MPITRRHLLGGLGLGAALGTGLLGRPVLADGPAGPLFVTTARASEGHYRVAGLTGTGTIRFELPLPGRAHGMAIHPSRPQAVIMARRPGRFALVVDLARGQAGPTLAPPAGRVYEGHAVFSADGGRLFTCENDYDGERGVIGVWDADRGFTRLGEFPSHGIEPHELILLPDGVLAVANGGILTHPDTGRAKLNIPTMDPNLAYLDGRDGRLLSSHGFADRRRRKLSIRHLAADGEGRICMALQDQGAIGERLPLVAFHRRGEAELQLVDAPAATQRAMVGYAGSVALDGPGDIAAVSAPLGNLVTFWSLKARRFARQVEIADGCAVCGTGRAGQFLITSGKGGALLFDAGSGTRTAVHSPVVDQRSWDNHMMATCI